MIVFISIEDTFAHGPDLRTAAGYRGARPLFESLRQGYQLVGLSQAPPDICRWWLRREHLEEWSQLLFYDPDLFPDRSEWKVVQVRNFQAEGWEIAFYLDNDIRALSDVHGLGVSTLRIDHASTRPGWRDPETTAPRAWANLASTVELADSEGTHHGPG